VKTSELIEHTAGPMLDDRANLLEGASDQLFATSTVLRYLNEAQMILCREGLVLEDKTTPTVCEITLVEGQAEYDLHPSILIVKAARLSDTDIDLGRVGYDDNRYLSDFIAYEPDYWDVNFSFTAENGRPSRYSTDMGTRTIRLSDAPDADHAGLKLKLTVIRLPLSPLAEDEPDAEPEVPEQYHLSLCKYAAGSCLSGTADVDSELRSLGRTWVNDFNEMARKAKRDKQRLNQPRPRFRFRGWVNDRQSG
jgi:hypothetical protein